jgi:hypothetical protein
MDNMKIDMIMNHLENLKIKMSSEEFANFVDENEFSLQDLHTACKKVRRCVQKRTAGVQKGTGKTKQIQCLK